MSECDPQQPFGEVRIRVSFRPIAALLAFLLGTTVLVSTSHACIVPYSGAEYDSQLSIESIDGRTNTFRITAPLQMNDAPLQVSILKWIPYLVPSDGKQPYKEIVLKANGELLVGEFSTPSREDAYEITLELWYGSDFGGCPTGAEADLDHLVE
jgi:hypothetical protein